MVIIHKTNLRNKITNSAQTDFSNFRRDNVTQTWLPKYDIIYVYDLNLRIFLTLNNTEQRILRLKQTAILMYLNQRCIWLVLGASIEV